MYHDILFISIFGEAIMNDLEIKRKEKIRMRKTLLDIQASKHSEEDLLEINKDTEHSSSTSKVARL